MKDVLLSDEYFAWCMQEHHQRRREENGSDMHMLSDEDFAWADSELEQPYRIVRFYRDSGKYEEIKSPVTLLEAMEHCRDPEADSNTCKNPEAKAITRDHGAWFDGYEEMH